jgi:hypothetical protein
MMEASRRLVEHPSSYFLGSRQRERKIEFSFQYFGGVSFIADIVTPNISLRIIPQNHPYSKFVYHQISLSLLANPLNILDIEHKS